MVIIRCFVSLVFLTLLGVFLIFSGQYAEAEEAKLPLIIEPIYPENQNPLTKGYFDLRVTTGDNQSLSVRITNKEDKEMTITMKAANAFTNPTGGMMYEQKIDSPDTVLLNDAVFMADNIKIEETVTVPPLSSLDVPIDVTVPELEGQTFLGGILFTTQGAEAEQQQEVEEGTANFVLKTETIYAIAVQLNLQTEVPSNFLFGKAGFSTETAQVFIEMTNNAQKIQEEITGTYSVLDDGGNDLFSGKFGPFKMAPKSKIRYPFEWGHETLEDGTYTLTIEGTFGGEKVSSSEAFTIKSKDVEEYMEKTKPNLPEAQVNRGIPTWIWILGAVLFGIVMFLLGRKRA
jgi:hypothetical protein